MSKNAAKKVKGQGSVAAVNPQLVFSKMGQNANAYYYVFNAGQNLGFTIVSGDDCLPEVLGYSDSGDFDINKIPDNMKWWLSEYEQQIEALRQSGVQAASESVELHETIEPLLTCQWNQDAPYYNSCPIFVNGNQTVTGCVATAMAQVLYHHRAKSVTMLQATIPSYLCYTHWDNGSQVSVNSFPAGSVIDWGNMLDTYNNSATDNQKKAVADLMAYCGASVEMDYANSASGGSGANEMGIPEAFKKYFGYSEAATIKYRDRFTADNWDRLIYRELMNGRPVIFGGQDGTTKAGHAFVCDGYSEGKYHFNWGWGGLADGYYVITNLAPTYQGIGGNGSAYNDNVDVVIGMEPGDGTPYEEKIWVTVSDFSKPETQTIKYSSGNTLFEYSYAYQNRTTSTRSFDVALALYQDGQFKTLLTNISRGEMPKIMTSKLSGYMGGSGNWWYSTYGAGIYQVKVVSRETDTEEWLESEDADKWYVDMIIEEDQISYVLHQYEEPEVVLGYDTDQTTISVDANGLATYCPEYGVDFTNATKIAAYKASVSGNTVTLTKVDKVAAGEGVLLRSLSGDAVEEILPVDEDAVENVDNAFVGTLTGIDALSETIGTKTNFVLSKKNGIIGFYKANNTKVPAGKAYLPVDNYNPVNKMLNIAFDDNTTGISEVTSEKIFKDDAIYTLGGTRVKNPTKGIYIKNGKKMVVK